MSFADDESWTRRVRYYRGGLWVVVVLLAAAGVLVVWTPWQDVSGQQAVCSDARDNDHDGKTDYPADPGCLSADDRVESYTAARPLPPLPPPPRPACSDARDNDHDNKTDHPNDPDCRSANDRAENKLGSRNPRRALQRRLSPAPIPSPARPACSDARDNDHDNMTDYPADPDCSSTEDGTEKH